MAGAAAGAAALLLVLLLLLRLGSAAPLAPRISRPFPEVEQMVQRFSHKAASNYSVFLVDPASGTLYVGAKNAVFALPLEGIGRGSRMIPWDVLQSARNSCKIKGKKEAECHNFVRILEFANGTHLLVCGTFAFDPQCGFIKVSDFHNVEGLESGRGKCPFEPLQPSAAVMADGVLYAATVNNFLGTEPIISRATGNPTELIRTDTSVAWLNDPEFVASAFIREGKSGDNDKIYFFFTETAREYDSYETVKVPRVARVCKGDLGGQKTLQKKWTTFLKTQLICSDPGTGKVFNILRDMVTLPSANWTTTVFYGVFAAQRNEGTGSAVCAYSMESIQRAMNGHFKAFKRDCDKWTSVMRDDVPDPRPGACVTHGMKLAGIGSSLALPDRVLTFVRDHPLMDQPASPLGNRPLLVTPDTQYLQLAVDRVTALSGQEHDVLYLGTEDGHLHKAVKIGLEASVIEDWTLFAERRPIRNLQVHQNWLYVASDHEVTQLSTSNCAKYGTCRECVLARDPACAWSEELGICRDHRGHTGMLIQNLTVAKVLSLCSLEKEEAPPVLEVPAPLTVRMVLPCAPHSAWSSCEWQRPSQDAAPYLLRGDGLEFTVTEATLGEYTCRCAEAGADGVVASYRLVQWAHAGPPVARSGERSYGVLVGVFCFVLGVIVSSACLLLHEWRQREHLQRELICRERNGLDLMPSTATSCSHEPQTPSSPEDERHPLATTKKNGHLNGGYPHLYINELDTEQACLYLTGVPLAKCDETSI